MGAVTGDHSFLKIVTSATTNPPIAPTTARPAAVSGERVSRFHDHAAVAIAHSRRMPVLLTVPERVMVSPRATPSPRKAVLLRAGFEVLIRFAIDIAPRVILLCYIFGKPGTN